MRLPLASCQGPTSTKISFFSQKNWEAITCCSDSCRKKGGGIKPNSLDTTFESKILSLLAQRRVSQGLAASVTCEEVEEEALKIKMNSHLEKGESRAVSESNPRMVERQSLQGRVRDTGKQPGP
jgi:hypothetical protein